MVRLNVNVHGGLYYSERIRSEQSVWQQTWRLEGFNEYCSPEIFAPSEAVEGMIVKCRLCGVMRKAEIL